MNKIDQLACGLKGLQGDGLQGDGGFDEKLIYIAPVGMQQQAPSQHGFNAFTE